MKKRPSAEKILFGIIMAALLMGALIGALITIGVIEARAAEEIPMDTFPAVSEDERAPLMIASTVAVKSEAVEPIPEEKPAEEKPTDYPVGTCEITAYCTCVKCCGIWSEDHPSRQGTGYVQKTATGTIPTEGRTVAVDPKVIPLGSVVMINGVGYIAEDTGSAISGKVVDIYFADHDAAVAFGRQTAHVSYIK